MMDTLNRGGRPATIRARVPVMLRIKKRHDVPLLSRFHPCFHINIENDILFIH